MPDAGSPAASYDALMAASGLGRAEARILLAALLGCDKTWLIAHGDETAPASLAEQARALFARRLAGEPVAYLLGAREFYGRRFAVGPAVLIPRPETEGLIDWALALLPGLPGRARALDLGCGSGCIGLTLALEAAAAGFGLGHLALVDQSAPALELARRNAVDLAVAGALEAGPPAFHEGDWFAPLAGQEGFDLVLANPPYIAPGDPHLVQGDLRFEPPQALQSPEQGLHDLRRIIGQAPARLKPGGWLLLEHGHDQAVEVAGLMVAAGFQAVQGRADLAGLPRLSGGRRGG